MVKIGTPHEQIQSPEFDKGRLSFDVWFGAHTLQHDFDGLGPLLKDRRYDIWVPEFVGVSYEHQELLRGMADGNRSAYQSMMRATPPESPLYGLFRSLYGSHLKVFFADYTPEQAASDEDFQEEHYSAFSFREVRTLKKAMAHTMDRANLAAQSYAKREVNIVNNLETGLPEFIERHPKLRDREDIRLLLSIGSAHVNLPDRLSEAGYRVKSVQQDTSLSPTVEIVRKVQRGEEVERSILVQAALELFISTALTHKDSFKLDAIKRQITESFSEEEVARLIPSFNHYGTELVTDFVIDTLKRLGADDPDLKVR